MTLKHYCRLKLPIANSQERIPSAHHTVKLKFTMSFSRVFYMDMLKAAIQQVKVLIETFKETSRKLNMISNRK